MKWKCICIGDKRTVTLFAWLPMYANDEGRWLESVTVEQQMAYGGWSNIRFVAAEKEES